MSHLDPEVIQQLIEKFGPTIDIQAKPEVLRQLIETAESALTREHYKGDQFTKSMPDGGEYTKNYFRGYCIIAGLDPDRDADLLEEVQAELDLILIKKLRERGQRAADQSHPTSD